MLEDRVFSKEESAEISDNYVAVRLLGGDDLDDEGKAFMRRYGVRGFPTLLALSPDGAVLTREFDRDTAGILAAMTQAATGNENFLKKEAELKSKTDAASVRELAGLYKDRAQYEQAKAGYEKLVSAANPEVDDQLALLGIVEALGDAPARRALLSTLCKTRADDARCIDWRMDLALADLPMQATSREEFMEVMGKQLELLTSLLGELESKADQAVVRNRIAGNLSRTGKQKEAVEHWNWILENARDSKSAPVALWVVAQEHFKKAQDPFSGEIDIKQLEAGTVLLQEILDKHGDHQMAQRAKMVIPRVSEAIEKQKAKDAEKKAEEEKKEEPADAGK